MVVVERKERCFRTGHCLTTLPHDCIASQLGLTTHAAEVTWSAKMSTGKEMRYDADDGHRTIPLFWLA
jgi:hypothetical protein